MAKVIIFGTGRGADVAYRYLQKDSDHEVGGFTVEPDYLDAETFRGLPVVDFNRVQEYFSPDVYKMFVPLGFQRLNKLRFEKYTAAKDKGYGFISYVSSTIPFQDDLQIGENCFILQNNSINFDVKIGNNVIIWSGNQIGDESVIGDHCWLSSQVCISGNVTIEPFTFVGINATISNNVTIAEENFIGANALITKNTSRQAVHIVEGTAKAPFSSARFIRMLEHSSD
jgi:sugar O-acyltransferase (sialic acid O-acetyltransferase NeuD family)